MGQTALDATQKRNRVTLCRDLLEALHREQQGSFEHIITGEESRFFFYYVNELAWAESRDKLSLRVKQIVNAE
jgi:hypothetical protein